MTKRNPISAQQNIWSNAQQVDDIDLTLEQDYNNIIESGIIQNHVGTGVLPELLTDRVIFDSNENTNFLDGVAVYPQNQPRDNNYGNQLKVELSDSKAAGKKTVKVAIIGTDINNNLQYETFVFKTNEMQVGKKHFVKVLLLLFNDLYGDPNYSLNLGGRLVISETNSLTLSRESVMISQDIYPSLFWRDFFVTSGTLSNLLKNNILEYDTTTLPIYTGILENKTLLINDVTTQVGQKFLATTNNIQKISILLSVENIINPSDLSWNGDLVISIYDLQSNVNCITDLVPNLPIDFPPTNIPLAQISISYSSLLAAGITLDGVPQPIDFVFSNSPVASGNVIIPGNYYAFTVKRSGSANKSNILIACGLNVTEESRITIFNGSLWTDLQDQDLWFRINTDSAKISDGQAYDSGFGVTVPKVKTDPITKITEDYSFEPVSFNENVLYSAVLAAEVNKTNPVPDQRTGNPILTRKEFVPSLSLLNPLTLEAVQKTAEPLIVGNIQDKNNKYFDSLYSQFFSKLFSASVVKDELIVKIVDDPNDTGRYDGYVKELLTHLNNGELVGTKIIPDNSNPSFYYRIASAKACKNILGDVNGDGIVDEQDLLLLESFVEYNLNTGLRKDTKISFSSPPTNVAAENGYTTYISSFVNASGLIFYIAEDLTGLIIDNNNDGVITADPNNNRLAYFKSSVIFSSIPNLLDKKIVIDSSSIPGDFGIFTIKAYDSTTNTLTIEKIYLDGKTIQQMFRADVDGDFVISNNDKNLLEAYINKDSTIISTPPAYGYTYPSSNPYNLIGTTFYTIIIKLEKFADRTDDYYGATPRSNNIHLMSDAFLDNANNYLRDYFNNPFDILFEKSLVWEDYLIVVNSSPQKIFCEFTSKAQENDCNANGNECIRYNDQPAPTLNAVDYYFPNNIIIGKNGNLKTQDGYFHKVDFEVGTIVLEVPETMDGYEHKINLMDCFVADYTGKGVTRLGFPSMKFSDCSTVTYEALYNNQVRFSASVQSFSPRIDGYDIDGYYGGIVDDRIGVNIDYTTGILTLNFSNLYKDPSMATRTTKLQINVFLKKAGFNNYPLFVDGTKIKNLFIT